MEKVSKVKYDQTLVLSNMESIGAFYVQCTGAIESADFGDADNLYCRYCFSIGADWGIVGGVDLGTSQMAQKSANRDQDIVWNFPIDITFKSTNIYGWPRMAISVAGLDFLGRDVIKGYGSVLIPLTPGRHTIEVDTFLPMSSSSINSIFSWLLGNPPEFFDSKLVCMGNNRDVTRTQKSGRVKVHLNIFTKGMNDAGFSISDASIPISNHTNAAPV